MPSKDKYSDPKLRDEVKEEIKQSDKGGEPGQWSARKAQMMAKEYKNRGGDYNTPKESKDESQKNLDKWGDEDWQTKEGSGEAKQDDGSRKRYLPKKAWEQMSEKEKDETDQKKQDEGKNDGKQYVQNTGKAKDARKKAGKEADQHKEHDDDAHHNESDESDEDTQSNGSSDSSHKENDSPSSASLGAKRGRKQNDNGNQGRKKQKTKSDEVNDNSKSTIGSKHDQAEAPAEQGSKERLPQKGQKNVHWKAMPGWVEGEVVEIVKKSKSVDGKQIKASQNDPRIVLKSKSSGKICVHKPDNIYFNES